MQRFIVCIAFLAAMVFLAGCASVAPAPSTEPVTHQLQGSTDAEGTGIFAVGTLAPLGSFEWKIAPSYTRLATVRHNAARALKQHRLTFADAVDVLDATDRARAALDAAVVADSKKDSKGAEREAAAGAAAIVEAESILNGAN